MSFWWASSAEMTDQVQAKNLMLHSVNVEQALRRVRLSPDVSVMSTHPETSTPLLTLSYAA